MCELCDSNTLNTEYVRAQYARQENYDDYYEGDLYLTPDGQLSAHEFDRWLAQREAEVVAAERERVLGLLGDYSKLAGDLLGDPAIDIEKWRAINNCIALIKGEVEVENLI